MRRKPVALLLSLSTAVAPFASPLSSRALSRLPHAAVESRAPRPVEASVLRAVHDRNVPRSPTELELTIAARARGVTVPQLRAAWQNVANCEVGGNWAMTGPVYSGIGFLNSTWTAFGGSRFAPIAGRATRDQQIVVAMRVTGGWIPDQNGCSAW